jgi:class 3 adenylate cyclase
VNTTARLASAAGVGEILLMAHTAAASAIDATGLERRDLALKGKADPTAVVVLGPR